jgi:hypothetical protein
VAGILVLHCKASGWYFAVTLQVWWLVFLCYIARMVAMFAEIQIFCLRFCGVA